MSTYDDDPEKGNDSEKKWQSTISRSPPEPIKSNTGEYEFFVRADDGGTRTICVSRKDGSEIPWEHEEYLNSIYEEHPVNFASRVRQDRFEISIPRRGGWDGLDTDLVYQLVEAL